MAARKLLYRSCKRIIDRHYVGQWPRFYEAVFGQTANHGIGYEDNFRSGRISRAKAAAIATWLSIYHPQEAIALDLAVRDLIEQAPLASWQDFIDGRAQNDTLMAIATDDLGIVGFANTAGDHITRVKLGQSFCLRLRSATQGRAIGFQRSRGQWFPLPLHEHEMDAAIRATDAWLPQSSIADTPLPLSEETDSGIVEFVVIVTDEDTARAIASSLTLGARLQSEQLLIIARQCDAAQSADVHRNRVQFI
jgi:hypothetical protein